MAAATQEKALAKPKRARESYGDLDMLAAALERVSRTAILVAPMVSIDSIPMYHEVSLRVVRIDPRDAREGGDTYNVQGKRGLGKIALAKLSQAARITWDGKKSGRVDDGSDPHYCAYHAVGYWPDWDGRTLIEIDGTRAIDLRDGSDLTAKMNSDHSKGDASKQIRDMRAFILEHAETKAKSRAIRQALTIKTSYTDEELYIQDAGNRLPRAWIVPALIETGHVPESIPHEIRMRLIEKYYDAVLSGAGLAKRALYGGSDPVIAHPGVPIFDVPAVVPAKQTQASEYIDDDTGEVVDDLDPFAGR